MDSWLSEIPGKNKTKQKRYHIFVGSVGYEEEGRIGLGEFYG